MSETTNMKTIFFSHHTSLDLRFYEEKNMNNFKRNDFLFLQKNYILYFVLKKKKRILYSLFLKKKKHVFFLTLILKEIEFSQKQRKEGIKNFLLENMRIYRIMRTCG